MVDLADPPCYVKFRPWKCRPIYFANRCGEHRHYFLNVNTVLLRSAWASGLGTAICVTPPALFRLNHSSLLTCTPIVRGVVNAS
jgi:hypothetical protein